MELFEGDIMKEDPKKMKLYSAEDMAAIYLEGFRDGYQSFREEIVIPVTDPGPECR